MANFLNNRGARVNPAPVAQNNNTTHQLATMIKRMRGINSPQGLMQMFGGNAEQIQQMQALMGSGQNPQQMAMNLMKQRGIDPNELMKELNS